MRLSAEQITQIKQVIFDLFGQDAEVWLFGSRVDDTKRGGDVDLYIESKLTDVFSAKIKAMRQLESLLPYPVDVVVFDANQDLAIYRIAKSEGVKL